MAVDKKIVQQLENGNLKARQQAVSVLRDAPEPVAVKILFAVSRRDPHSKLRELALGYAKQKDPQYVAEQLEKAVKVAEVPKKAAVAPEMQKRARGYAEEALTLHMSGNRAGALKSLKKSIDTNPDIIEDSYFTSMLNAVTGVEGEDAMQMITDRQKSEEVIKAVETEKKQKLASKHLEQAQKFSWGSVAFDLTIYFVIMAAGFFFAVFVLLQTVQNYLALLIESLGSTSSPALRPVMEMLNSASVAQFAFLPVLFACLAFAIGNTIIVFVQSGIIHGVSKSLGGKGTFGYQVYKLVGLYNTRFPIMFLVFYLGVWITFASGIPFLVFGAALMLTLIQFSISGSMSSRIAEAYHFTSMKGWLANLLASFVWVAANLVMSILLSNMLGSTLIS